MKTDDYNSLKQWMISKIPKKFRNHKNPIENIIKIQNKQIAIYEKNQKRN